jgi:hypothetical protein
VCRYPDPEG